MFSKLAFSLAARSQAPKAMRLAPQMINRTNHLVAFSQRTFIDRLGLESQTTEVSTDLKNQGEVSLW